MSRGLFWKTMSLWSSSLLKAPTCYGPLRFRYPSRFISTGRLYATHCYQFISRHVVKTTGFLLGHDGMFAASKFPQPEINKEMATAVT